MSEYIERAKAIETVKFYDGDPDGVPWAIRSLNDIPAADVKPVVRGEWRLYSPLTDTYECDKCGYQVIDESFRTNFCPNCGADMREKEKTDDKTENL